MVTIFSDTISKFRPRPELIEKGEFNDAWEYESSLRRLLLRGSTFKASSVNIYAFLFIHEY